jgi:DNA-binding CsgD family transcriptional regulator/predicted transcriptional regulator
MFDSLGITETTLAVYRALLERPRINSADVAELLGRSETEVEEQMEQLRRWRLLVPRWTSGQGHGEEHAIHPAHGFALLARHRQDAITELEQELRQDLLAAETFTAQYNESLRRQTAMETEIFEGREAAHQRMQEFTPKKSIWGMVPNRMEGQGATDESPDKPYLELNLDHRYLFIESHVKNRLGLEYSRWLVEHGAKVRTAPSLPMRLVIFDGESVAMPLDPDNYAAGAVVHHSRPVVYLAESMYEYYWQHATDLFDAEQGTDNEITAQEAELLNLLVEGATDEQAGRKLGVSLRTVRRMAAKLSEQAGASGRFELGVRAAQRGWVR